MESEARPTPTVEDYLGVIYTLERDQEPVIGRKLAEWMEVSPPTVTATLQRMVRDGWVTMAPDKTIHLTDAGRLAAVSLVRRHMLTELLLARVLNVPWSRVHEEADRLEHTLSPETTARVAELLYDTDVCPHGNPLPGQEGSISDLVPLLQAEPGRPYVLARVHEQIERHGELMGYFEEHGLVPGVRLQLLQIVPTNETAILRIDGREVSVGLGVARCLWVHEA